MIKTIRNIIKTVEFWRVKLLFRFYENKEKKAKFLKKEAEFLKSAYDKLMIEYEQIKSLKLGEEGDFEFLNEMIGGWYYNDWGQMRCDQEDIGYNLKQDGEQYSVFYKEIKGRHEKYRIIKIVFNYRNINIMNIKSQGRIHRLQVLNSKRVFFYGSLYNHAYFDISSLIHNEYFTIKIYEGEDFDNLINDRQIMKKIVYLFGNFFGKVLKEG